MKILAKVHSVPGPPADGWRIQFIFEDANDVYHLHPKLCVSLELNGDDPCGLFNVPYWSQYGPTWETPQLAVEYANLIQERIRSLLRGELAARELPMDGVPLELTQPGPEKFGWTVENAPPKGECGDSLQNYDRPCALCGKRYGNHDGWKCWT